MNSLLSGEPSLNIRLTPPGNVLRQAIALGGSPHGLKCTEETQKIQ
jgi:hypothetical protein